VRDSDTEGNFEERLSELERQHRSFARVLSAVADDTLRVCVLVEELSTSGHLPPLPWRLATAIVDLHHALLAKKNQETMQDSGVTLEGHISALQENIRNLREELGRSRRVDAKHDPTPEKTRPPEGM
jgi:hypothetical protein